MFVNTVTPEEFTLPPEKTIVFHFLMMSICFQLKKSKKLLNLCQSCFHALSVPELFRNMAIYKDIQMQVITLRQSIRRYCQTERRLSIQNRWKKINVKTPCIENVSSTNQMDQLKQGWTLKSRREIKRFTSNQKKYLVEKFEFSEKTDRKCDPEEIAQQMRIRNKK